MNRVSVRLPVWTRSAARLVTMVLDAALVVGALVTTYMVFAAHGG